MATKKTWLKTRLHHLGKTSAGLARHLKVEGPRIYEVIGGRRLLQPHEIAPTAKFLDWTTEELVKRLPPNERVVWVPKKPMTITTARGNGMTEHLTRATIPLLDNEGKVKGHLKDDLDARPDLFAVYLSGKQMSPKFDDGELILGEKLRPPREDDYVVIFLTASRQKQYMVVQLKEASDHKVVVQQRNPEATETIDRSAITSMYRVIKFSDVVR